VVIAERAESTFGSQIEIVGDYQIVALQTFTKISFI
jgi:hypothetical protein